MRIRLATKNDIQSIYDLLLPYEGESWFKGKTINTERALKYIEAWIDDCITILCEDEGIVGIAVVCFSYTFWEEKEGELNFMFVAKSHRGKGVSRILRDECVRQMEYNGAKIQYAMSASGVQENLFINLWGKAGFKRLGTIVVRDLTDNQNNS